MPREPPAWLDENFLATVLQGGENKEPPVKILSFSATPAVAAGNNYTSHLYRVRVEYKVGEAQEKSISLIVKAPITTGVINDMSKDFDVFSKEPKIYGEILPKMKSKTNNEFGPDTFYCPVKNGLVLKDMKEEGYVMCDKFKKLDYSHCKHALTTLARFHAASVACHHDCPQLVEEAGKEFMYTMDGSFKEEMKPWLENCLKTVAQIVSEMNDYKPVEDLLYSRIENIGESLAKICSPKAQGLNVLTHGDLWINNMLFKHNDSGEVTDVKLIDFQMPRYASPVLDLLYFMWSSAHEDVREDRQQELYDIYLRTLNDTLEQLGCEERMSAEEMKQDFQGATDWALITVCNVLPFLMCESEEAINMEEVSMDDFKSAKPDERFQKMYRGKNYLALLPKLIKQLQAWVFS